MAFLSPLRPIWVITCKIKAAPIQENLMLSETNLNPTVHAFDFDGTLTYKDSFTAFLLWECGKRKTAATLALKPSILAHYLRSKDRGALKSNLLFNLLGRISKEDLDARFASFAKQNARKLFRPDAIRTWETLGSDTDLRVIVTASPEMLVQHFGTLLKSNKVIGTRLGFDSDNRLTAILDGINCRNEEKVKRLKTEFGEDMILKTAFGDTSGDFEMLKAAQNGHYRLFKLKP
jgi:phosphatidylglycerophosphatase C